MMRISRIYFWVLLIVLSSCSVKKSIQTTSTTTSPTITANPYSATFLINDTDLNTAHIGIALYDADSNNYLYQYQSNKYFIPASNTKILTCYAAMKYLGDSLEGLRYLGNTDGSINIQGTGDPTFLHPAFKDISIYNFLSKQSIINYCEDCSTWQFKPFGKGWTNDDYYEDYMNERSVIPIYGNNRSVYSRLDSTVYYVSPSQNLKNIYAGSQGLRSTVNYYITDTSSKELPFYLKLLIDTLRNNKLQTINCFKSKLYKIIYSYPTDTALSYMMHNSDNFFAEQLLLMASNKHLGEMNDVKMFDTLLVTDFKDFPQKPKWVDACGLSRYNLFTPEDIIYVLGKVRNEFKQDRIKAIFPAGNQGTLKGYYTNYSDNIYAKTGSMSGVFCISGYLTSKQNKHITFSVMVNNHQAKGETLRRKIEAYLSKVFEEN